MNIKPETIIPLEDNLHKLPDTGLADNFFFFSLTSKAKATEPKINKQTVPNQRGVGGGEREEAFTQQRKPSIR